MPSASTLELPQPETIRVRDWAPSMDSIYRLSIEQFEAMVASGVFKKRDRLRLINGFLVSKKTEHPPHAVASTMLWESMLPLVPRGWHLRLDKPLRIPVWSSVPEPDLAWFAVLLRTISKVTLDRWTWPWWSKSPTRVSRSIRRWRRCSAALVFPDTESSIWSTASLRCIRARARRGMRLARFSNRTMRFH